MAQELRLKVVYNSVVRQAHQPLSKRAPALPETDFK